MRSAEQGETITPVAYRLHETRDEARRVFNICNACRYCEGYCAVFPAMMRRRTFDDASLDYLANLCHNCRSCYYACQYAPPHEFALNLPATLADLRVQSWSGYAWPRGLGRAFAANGLVLAVALALGIAAMIWLASLVAPAPGAEAFYAVIPHSVMVAVFAPVFLFALLAMAVSVVRFWRATDSPSMSGSGIRRGLSDTFTLRHLGGGHGEGCNYEAAEEYSNQRRLLHHAIFYGFMLCFASTASASVLHYAFASPAPYDLWSVPKLLGVPGGVALCIGTAGLFVLKRRSAMALGARDVRGMETGFVALLFLASASGLVLYAFRGTAALEALLAVHLGAVLAFFATLPYSKMVHGLYRVAALIRSATADRCD